MKTVTVVGKPISVAELFSMLKRIRRSKKRGVPLEKILVREAARNLR